MKTISLENHLDDYKVLFNDLVDSSDSLIVWQIQEGKRVIKAAKIHSLDLESFIFVANILEGQGPNFNSDEVYFYSKSQNIIFKASLENVIDTAQFYQLPKEIKIINEAETPAWMNEINLSDLSVFVKGYGFANIPQETTRVRGEGRANINQATHMRGNTVNGTEHISTKWRLNSMSEHDSELFETELSFVSLDEEDRLYADQRSAPRARPPKNKMICVQLGERTIGEMFSLFDLSQGGLGFITSEKNKFEVGQNLNILGFDDKSFEAPMVVVVKAIRDTDDSGLVFKVGCAFQG